MRKPREIDPEMLAWMRAHAARREGLIRGLQEDDSRRRIRDYMRKADAFMDRRKGAESAQEGPVERVMEVYEIDVPGVEFLPSEPGYYTVRMTPEAAGVAVAAMVEHVKKGWEWRLGDLPVHFDEKCPV